MGIKIIEKMIRNEEIRAKAGMANISEKIREASEMVKETKTEEDSHVVMRKGQIEVGGHRKIGSPKLRWSDIIRKEHSSI